MKMNDDALVVAISPDAKYIAVALLDSTVKVRFLNLWFPKQKLTCKSKYVVIYISPVHLKMHIRRADVFHNILVIWEF